MVGVCVGGGGWGGNLLPTVTEVTQQLLIVQNTAILVKDNIYSILNAFNPVTSSPFVDGASRSAVRHCLRKPDRKINKESV